MVWGMCTRNDHMSTGVQFGKETTEKEKLMRSIKS